MAIVSHVRQLQGSASLVSKAAGTDPVPFFEYSFTLEWRMGDGSASGTPRSSGTLSYAEVVAGADGASVCTGDVTHTVAEKEEGAKKGADGDEGDSDDGDGDKADGDEAGKGPLPIERTLEVLDVLKTVIADALAGFQQAVVAKGVATAPVGAAGAAAAEVEEMDEDEPIGFEDYKKQKAEEEKQQKDHRDEMERKAREERDAERRRARKADKVVIDKEDGLEQMRGYKIRADGSKTSYFDRQVDAETKALLDKQKQPKRLSVGTDGGGGGGGAASAQSAAGSAWNTGGTWEEKDMSEWAKGDLTSRLESVACAAGEPPCTP